MTGASSGADLAAGPGAGGGDGHPQLSVGVSFLDDVVRDGTATVVQRRAPGDHHVVPVDLVEYYRTLWRLWSVWKRKDHLRNTNHTLSKGSSQPAKNQQRLKGD